MIGLPRDGQALSTNQLSVSEHRRAGKDGPVSGTRPPSPSKMEEAEAVPSTSGASEQPGAAETPGRLLIFNTVVDKFLEGLVEAGR